MMNNMPYPMPNYIPYQNPIDQKILHMEENLIEIEKRLTQLEKKLIDKPKPNFLSSNVSNNQGIYMI